MLEDWVWILKYWQFSFRFQSKCFYRVDCPWLRERFECGDERTFRVWWQGKGRIDPVAGSGSSLLLIMWRICRHSRWRCIGLALGVRFIPKAGTASRAWLFWWFWWSQGSWFYGSFFVSFFISLLGGTVQVPFLRSWYKLLLSQFWQFYSSCLLTIPYYWLGTFLDCWPLSNGLITRSCTCWAHLQMS